MKTGASNRFAQGFRCHSPPQKKPAISGDEGAAEVHEQERLHSVLEKPRWFWLGYELRRKRVLGHTL